MFSRGKTGDTAELRGDCPRHILNALDAVAIARDMTRTSLVNEILGEWAAKKRHELIILQRLDAGNPQLAEASGGSRA